MRIYMNKSLIKKLIIIFAVLLVVVLILFAIVLSNHPEQGTQIEAEEQNIIEMTDQMEEEKMSKVEAREKFYIVKQSVYSYVDIINTRNSIYYGYNDDGEMTKLYDENERIYNLLSTSYIQANNITTDNINNFITKIDSKALFVPLEVKYRGSDNLYKYAISGYITDLQYNVLQNIYLIVNLDLNNSTFSIEPIAEVDSIQNVDLGTEELQPIEQNADNAVDYITANEQYVSNDYLDTFKKMMLSNPEAAFNRLDAEYREKRFTDLAGFTEYITENRDTILTITLQQYQTNNFDDYTQYVGIDQYGNYYVFNERDVMDYSVLLDTYTVDLPQFTETYSSSSDADKGLLNINKVTEAMKMGDYNFIYSKLDETFKQNNFSTIEAFETYMDELLYDQNNIEVTNYQNSGDLHIYTVTISNGEDASSPAITKNFIVKLTDGTNFVMSFNV